MSQGSQTLLDRSFPARSAELKAMRAAVREAVIEAGAQESCADDVVMAVDEACQNVIRHAYGGECEGVIRVRLERHDEALVVSILDFAPSVDPDCMRGRDLDELRPGGLGTHLIRHAMDEVGFEEPPPGCGNLLRMVKRLR